MASGCQAIRYARKMVHERRVILITGGAGFLGDLLKRDLLDRGFTCVSVDLTADSCAHPSLTAVQGDIRDTDTLEKIAAEQRIDAIFHLAAKLAHSVNDKRLLWTTNVEGTRNVAELAKKFHIPKVVFTSSNSLWGENFDREVREDEPPRPVEIYGRSKWEGEKILLEHDDDFDAVVFRCPTIVDSGRLGLLAILFEFIDEGRKVWVVGGGKNRYQFIYAQDLISAFVKALDYKKSAVLNIGCDEVQTFREAYEYVISRAGTGARIANFPSGIALPLMRLAHRLRVSPLGPYQYKMISKTFVFDTSAIKEELGWQPTLNNQEMLYKAYRYYHDNLSDIRDTGYDRVAKMGIIRALKWIS
jgi:UDP-glucose 4-epimerase